MKTYKRVCLLVLAFLLAATPLVMLAGAGVFGIGSVFGYRFLNFLSGSMSPAINAGDMVVVKPCKPERVRVGDDITYASESVISANGNILITHRVKEILTERGSEQGLWFVTQGLNNATPDLPVESNQLVGKVIMRLPGLGTVTNWMRGHIAISIVAAVLLCLFCLPAAVLLAFLALRGRRR